MTKQETTFFNLGINNGNTVKEVFSLCEEVTNKKIDIKNCPRREGDPETLVADKTKAKQVLNWQPKRDLEHSVKATYSWEVANTR